MSRIPANIGSANTRSMGHRIRIGAAIFILLVCVNGAVRAQGSALLITSPSQPLNVGDAIIAATAYHESGAYDRDVELVARQAAEWIAERAPSASRPALVLDVDETALSNWEVITRDNFGRSAVRATWRSTPPVDGLPGINSVGIPPLFRHGGSSKKPAR